MAHRPFILFPSPTAWRIASPGATDDVPVDADASAEQTAAAVAGQLRSRGYSGQGVLLAIPSDWCLAASISTAGVPRNDRAALCFRLEEKLPVAAEQFTADFVQHGDAALGVAALNDRLLPVVQALEGAGVVVQSIAPAALLALQAMADAAPSGRIVLLQEGDHVSLISLEGGQPVGWALVEAEPASVRVALDLALMQLPEASVRPHGLAASLLAALHGYDLSQAAVSGERVDQSAASLAPAILSGRVRPWVEFRRDALAVTDRLRVIRRPLNAALVAATLCCLVLGGVFLFRAHQYDQLADRHERDLAERFRSEFPNWDVPANVRVMVASELKKLKAAGTSALPVEARESALRILHDVFARLSEESTAGITIDRMTLNDTSLEIEGRAKTNDAVDPLVSAVRAAGLDAPPPQMRKLNQPVTPWSFTIKGAKATAGAVGSVQ